MWFYDIERISISRTPKMVPVDNLATDTKTQRANSTFGGIEVIIAIFILAFVAYGIGWSTGADKLLNAGIGVVVGLIYGAFKGESAIKKRVERECPNIRFVPKYRRYLRRDKED